MVMRNTRFWSLVALLGSAVLLTACGSTDGAGDSPFGPGSPGRYTVGDRFTFDNPVLTWAVVAVEGDKVFWRSDRGDEQVTGHDPLMPALEWKNPGRGGGRRTIVDEKGGLFPLQEGGRLTFTSMVEGWTEENASDTKKWQYGWSCSTESKEEIAVQAGTFDTYKIQCGRVKPDELVFYYAPKIGHYVVMRIDDPQNDSTITRNLISFSRIALGGSPLPEDFAAAPPPMPPAPPPAPVVPTPATPPPAPPPPPPTTPKAAPAPPPTVAAGKGPRVHIASFSSEENAERGWGIYQREHRELLGGLAPHIVRADLGTKGIFFRLMTQRLQDRAAAKELCRKLKAKGVGCRVTSN